MLDSWNEISRGMRGSCGVNTLVSANERGAQFPRGARGKSMGGEIFTPLRLGANRVPGSSLGNRKVGDVGRVTVSGQNLARRIADMRNAALASSAEYDDRVGYLVNRSGLSSEMQALLQKGSEALWERESCLRRLDDLDVELESGVGFYEILQDVSEIDGRFITIEQRLAEVEVGMIRSGVLGLYASEIVSAVNPNGIDGLCGKEVTVSKAREMGRCFAGRVARLSFDNRGKVNKTAVVALRDSTADRRDFQDSFCDGFPCLWQTCFQTSCVLNHLLLSDEFEDILEKVDKMQLGTHGREISIIMSNSALSASSGRQRRLMQPQELILTSLFSLHRQGSLPTCTLDSALNNIIHNFPWLLARMQASALTSGCFKTPGGYPVQLLQIANGYITLDLKHGGDGRNDVFEDIDSGDQEKVDTQIEEWCWDGILYDPAVARYELKFPIFDLNDLCFTALFQETIGNKRVNGDKEYGTTYVLFGIPINADDDIYSLKIDARVQNNIPWALKEEARIQRSRGVCCMRVASERVGERNESHSFNIDIDELLYLNLRKMRNGQIHCIGDLNGMDLYGSDILRFAIQKIGKRFQFCEVLFAKHSKLITRIRPMTDYTAIFVYDPMPTFVRRILARGRTKRIPIPYAVRRSNGSS
jgi:hypothetical protein